MNSSSEYFPIIPIARVIEQFIIPDLATLVGEYARSSDDEIFRSIDWSCRLSEQMYVERRGATLCAVDPDVVSNVKKCQVRCALGKAFDRDKYNKYAFYHVWISADLDVGYFGLNSDHIRECDLRDVILRGITRDANHAPILLFRDVLLSRLRAAIVDYE
jgi:hypothetical protein